MPRGVRPPLNRARLVVPENVYKQLTIGVSEIRLSEHVAGPFAASQSVFDYDRVIFVPSTNEKEFKEYEFEGAERVQKGRIRIHLGDKTRQS